MINGQPLKMLQFDDGTIVTVPRLFYEIWNGNAFSSSCIVEGVSNGGLAEALFENPSNSGVEATVIVIEVSSFGRGHIKIYRNPTIADQGTSNPILNLNLGSTNSPQCLCHHTPSWSGGTIAHQTILPGGTKSRALGELAEVGESVFLPPGNSLIIQFINKAGTSVDVSFRTIWFELEIS